MTCRRFILGEGVHDRRGSMTTLDTADRDRLGGPTFAWIDRHGERLRRTRIRHSVSHVLARLNQLDPDRRRHAVGSSRFPAIGTWRIARP
jgi:hypothetical protein